MTNISEMNVINAIDQSKVAQTHHFALVKTMKEMMGVMFVAGEGRTVTGWGIPLAKFVSYSSEFCG